MSKLEYIQTEQNISVQFHTNPENKEAPLKTLRTIASSTPYKTGLIKCIHSRPHNLGPSLLGY